MSRNQSRIHSLLLRSVQVEPAEVTALLWSFSYFFALLCSYYIIRPMRDEMGILGGVENLQWLFTGTLIAMAAAVPLFGWVSSRFPRRRFLPYVYGFFILVMLLFYLLMDERRATPYVARAFFYLGQRVQSVRGLRFLEFYDRHLRESPGTPSVRIHCRWRHRGSADRPGPDHTAGTATGGKKPAAGFRPSALRGPFSALPGYRTGRRTTQPITTHPSQQPKTSHWAVASGPASLWLRVHPICWGSAY